MVAAMMFSGWPATLEQMFPMELPPDAQVGPWQTRGDLVPFYDLWGLKLTEYHWISWVISGDHRVIGYDGSLVIS